jgi:hypothetical protein
MVKIKEIVPLGGKHSAPPGTVPLFLHRMVIGIENGAETPLELSLLFEVIQRGRNEWWLIREILERTGEGRVDTAIEKETTVGGVMRALSEIGLQQQTSPLTNPPVPV